MSKKTQWHIDINGGTIPLFETPEGNIIYESDVVMEAANEISKDGPQLWPTDPMKKYKQKLETTKLTKDLPTAVFTPWFVLDND